MPRPKSKKAINGIKMPNDNCFAKIATPIVIKAHERKVKANASSLALINV